MSYTAGTALGTWTIRRNSCKKAANSRKRHTSRSRTPEHMVGHLATIETNGMQKLTEEYMKKLLKIKHDIPRSYTSANDQRPKSPNCNSNLNHILGLQRKLPTCICQEQEKPNLLILKRCSRTANRGLDKRSSKMCTSKVGCALTTSVETVGRWVLKYKLTSSQRSTSSAHTWINTLIETSGPRTY